MVYGYGGVGEIWNYPGWVDRLCGGRIISKPLTGGLIKACRL